MEHIPPVVRVLLAESFEGIHTGPAIRRRLKPLMRDLKAQAAWSLDNHNYFDPHAGGGPSRFILRPSGALDPFSPLEVCAGVRCRFNTAEQFARSVGLLADTVVLPDVFTPYFIDTDSLDDLTARRLMRDIVVLERLKPLIEAGVIRFNDLRLDTDDTTTDKALDDITVAVLREIEPELAFTRHGSSITISTGRLFHRPLSWTFSLTSAMRELNTRDVAIDAFQVPLRDEILNIVNDLREAGRVKAILASGSRLGVLAVRLMEERLPALDSVESWEALRSVDLPWVENLSPLDVLALREEAADALPRLRALVGQKIARVGEDTDEKVVELVNELRSEAAEVEAELRSLRFTKQRGFRTLTGTLGLTIAVYGISAGFITPAVGLGTLLSLLGLIHGSERQDERDRENLIARPGYLLLKARELLEHRH